MGYIFVDSGEINLPYNSLFGCNSDISEVR